MFSVINAYAEHYPHTDVAKRALIEEGRRASEPGRWDVMASAFRQYAAQYPRMRIRRRRSKLVGDAMYKSGKYRRRPGTVGFGVRDRRAHRAASAGGLREAHPGRRRVDVRRLARQGRAVSAGGAEVYVAYADANPTSEKAADALRDAIETYMLADSVARRAGDEAASKDARTHAAELSKRLITQYPLYRYRLQYQTLYADLLAEIGKGDESIEALRKMIEDNPEWHGRADAEIRLAVRLDSLATKKEAATAYEQFAVGLSARQAGERRAVQRGRDVSGGARHNDRGRRLRRLRAAVPDR